MVLTELYRPEPGVWRDRYGHLNYKMPQYKASKGNETNDGSEIYKGFNLIRYKAKIFADEGLFPIGSGGADTLSKCGYSFCSEQDRYRLRGLLR